MMIMRHALHPFAFLFVVSCASSLGLRQFHQDSQALLAAATLTRQEVEPRHFHHEAFTVHSEQQQPIVETRVSELLRVFEPVVIGQLDLQDMDCAQLLKACRVSEGIMRRIGAGNSARDLAHNIQKIESLYHAAPPSHRGTVSSLLAYEKSLGIHSEPSRLKDPSGAMGMLWIRRSIQFQHKMYTGILRHETYGEEDHTVSARAGMIAYRSELEPFHGWTLRKLYGFTIQRYTPPPREILARLGGFPLDDFGLQEELATRKDIAKLLAIWEPLIHVWKSHFDEYDLDDDRKV